ncbi:MAG: hypothetical protein AAF750_02830, partial [Planctomycetota bacterium]
FGGFGGVWGCFFGRFLGGGGGGGGGVWGGGAGPAGGGGGGGGGGGASLGDALVDRVPDGGDFMEVVDVGTAAVGRFEVYQARVTAALCGFVEGVESVLGFEALPQPSDDELIRPMLLATEPTDTGGMVLAGDAEPSRRSVGAGAVASAGAGLGSVAMATVVVAGGVGALMASGMITRVGSAPRPAVVAETRAGAEAEQDLTTPVAALPTAEPTGPGASANASPEALAMVPVEPEPGPAVVDEAASASSSVDASVDDGGDSTGVADVGPGSGSGEVASVDESAEAAAPAVAMVPAPDLPTLDEALAALESGDGARVSEGLAYLAYHEPEESQREAVRLALGSAVRVNRGADRSAVVRQAARWGGDHGMAFFDANRDVLQRSREAHQLLTLLSELEDRETLNFILDHAACWDPELAVSALADRPDAVEEAVLSRLAMTNGYAVHRARVKEMRNGLPMVRRPILDGPRGAELNEARRRMEQERAEHLGLLDAAGCLLAVAYLSEHGTEAAVNVLMMMRDHRDAAVRGEVMAALQRLAPRRVDAVGRLLEQMPATSSVPMGGQSEALAILTDLAAIEPDDRSGEVAVRLARLMSSSDAMLRSRAMTAAAAWPDPLYRPVLRKLLSDSAMEQSSVPQAIAMLAAGGQRADATVIGRWLIKEERAVVAALISMGELGEPVAMRYLTHKKPEVRLACLEVLGEIGGRRSGRAVSARRSDPDPDVSLAAELAFAKLKARVEAAEKREEVEQQEPVEPVGTDPEGETPASVEG